MIDHIFSFFRNKFPNLIKSGAAKSLFKPDEKEGGDEKDEEEGGDEKDEEEDEGLVMKSMDEDDVDGGVSSKQHSPDKEVCQCFTPRPSLGLPNFRSIFFAKISFSQRKC